MFVEKEGKSMKKKGTGNRKAHSVTLFALSALFLISWAYNFDQNTITGILDTPKTFWYKVGTLIPFAAGVVALVGGILVVKRKSVSPASKRALWLSLFAVYFIALSFPSAFPPGFAAQHEVIYTLITLACEFFPPMIASYFLGMIPGLSFVILPIVFQISKLYSFQGYPSSAVFFTLGFTISQFLSVISAVMVPFYIDLPAALCMICGLSDAVLIKAILNMAVIELIDSSIHATGFIDLLPYLILSLILHTAAVFRKINRRHSLNQ